MDTNQNISQGEEQNVSNQSAVSEGIKKDVSRTVFQSEITENKNTNEAREEEKSFEGSALKSKKSDNIYKVSVICMAFSVVGLVIYYFFLR